MKRWLALLPLLTICSAQTYKPSESNLKARQWFQDAKFVVSRHAFPMACAMEFHCKML